MSAFQRDRSTSRDPVAREPIIISPGSTLCPGRSERSDWPLSGYVVTFSVYPKYHLPREMRRKAIDCRSGFFVHHPDSTVEGNLLELVEKEVRIFSNHGDSRVRHTCDGRHPRYLDAAIVHASTKFWKCFADELVYLIRHDTRAQFEQETKICLYCSQGRHRSVVIAYWWTIMLCYLGAKAKFILHVREDTRHGNRYCNCYFCHRIPFCGTEEQVMKIIESVIPHLIEKAKSGLLRLKHKARVIDMIEWLDIEDESDSSEVEVPS